MKVIKAELTPSPSGKQWRIMETNSNWIKGKNIIVARDAHKALEKFYKAICKVSSSPATRDVAPKWNQSIVIKAPPKIAACYRRDADEQIVLFINIDGDINYA